MDDIRIFTIGDIKFNLEQNPSPSGDTFKITCDELPWNSNRVQHIVNLIVAELKTKGIFYHNNTIDSLDSRFNYWNNLKTVDFNDAIAVMYKLETRIPDAAKLDQLMLRNEEEWTRINRRKADKALEREVEPYAKAVTKFVLDEFTIELNLAEKESLLSSLKKTHQEQKSHAAAIKNAHAPYIETATTFILDELGRELDKHQKAKMLSSLKNALIESKAK